MGFSPHHLQSLNVIFASSRFSFRLHSVKNPLKHRLKIQRKCNANPQKIHCKSIENQKEMHGKCIENQHQIHGKSKENPLKHLLEINCPPRHRPPKEKRPYHDEDDADDDNDDHDNDDDLRKDIRNSLPIH